MHNKCNALESSPNYPPCPSPIHRTVFHETSPLYKKVVVDGCFKVQIEGHSWSCHSVVSERCWECSGHPPQRTRRLQTLFQEHSEIRVSTHSIFPLLYSRQPTAICYLLSIDQKLLVPSYFGPFYYIINNSHWHPTPVLLPGESHGWRSLVGYSPWGR